MSDAAGEAQKPSALTQWFESMRTGTAKQLHALAAAIPGVLWARVLEDPDNTEAIVVLVELTAETSPQAVADCIIGRAPAGSTVEVIRVSGTAQMSSAI